MMTPACAVAWLSLLLLLARGPAVVHAAGAANCYAGGSGGWDVVWWGENPRLPSGGPAIPVCIGWGYVNFKWRQPQGVFLIPSEECPADFSGNATETFQELAAVSNSGVYSFQPTAEVASYWLTSQVPGACQAGTIVRVDVIPTRSSGTRLTASLLAAAVAAVTAAALIPVL